MTWENAVVMADNLAVWDGATVAYLNGELKIYVAEGGGGLVLDETFSNVDIYEPHGAKVVFSSSTSITDDGGNEYNRITVREIRACGGCGSRR